MQRVDFIPPVSNGPELCSKLQEIIENDDRRIVQVVIHFGFIVISEPDNFEMEI